MQMLCFIIMIADSYDAMTTDRPYRQALTITEAIMELKNNKGRQFDNDLCEKMITILNEESQLQL